MKLSILILTQPLRARFLARLMAVLRPQVEEHPDIEICTRTFDQNMDLGTNRQMMIESANGTYCVFIDDDDLVPAFYVERIYPLLDGVVDYIGFQLQCFIDDQKQLPTFHSLRYKEWNGDNKGWYRDISHVNPIRRELALQVPMAGWHGEDHRWADALRARNIVKTEHYVDEILYFYYFRSNKGSEPQYSAASQRAADGQFITRPGCPKCGSTATGMGGGMRRCNQCQHAWI